MKRALQRVVPPSSKACGSCVRCICARQKLEAQTKKQRKQELQAAKRIQACMPCHHGRADLINAAAIIEQKLAGRILFPAPSPSAPCTRQRQIDRPKWRFPCDPSRTYSHAVIEFGIQVVFVGFRPFWLEFGPPKQGDIHAQGRDQKHTFCGSKA